MAHKELVLTHAAQFGKLLRETEKVMPEKNRSRAIELLNRLRLLEASGDVTLIKTIITELGDLLGNVLVIDKQVAAIDIVAAKRMGLQLREDEAANVRHIVETAARDESMRIGTAWPEETYSTALPKSTPDRPVVVAVLPATAVGMDTGDVKQPDAAASAAAKPPAADVLADYLKLLAANKLKIEGLDPRSIHSQELIDAHNGDPTAKKKLELLPSSSRARALAAVKKPEAEVREAILAHLGRVYTYLEGSLAKLNDPNGSPSLASVANPYFKDIKALRGLFAEAVGKIMSLVTPMLHQAAWEEEVLKKVAEIKEVEDTPATTVAGLVEQVKILVAAEKWIRDAMTAPPEQKLAARWNGIIQIFTAGQAEFTDLIDACAFLLGVECAQRVRDIANMRNLHPRDVVDLQADHAALKSSFGDIQEATKGYPEVANFLKAGSALAPPLSEEEAKNLAGVPAQLTAALRTVETTFVAAETRYKAAVTLLTTSYQLLALGNPRAHFPQFVAANLAALKLVEDIERSDPAATAGLIALKKGTKVYDIDSIRPYSDATKYVRTLFAAKFQPAQRAPLSPQPKSPLSPQPESPQPKSPQPESPQSKSPLSPASSSVSLQESESQQVSPFFRLCYEYAQLEDEVNSLEDSLRAAVGNKAPLPEAQYAKITKYATEALRLHNPGVVGEVFNTEDIYADTREIVRLYGVIQQKSGRAVEARKELGVTMMTVKFAAADLSAKLIDAPTQFPFLASFPAALIARIPAALGASCGKWELLCIMHIQNGFDYVSRQLYDNMPKGVQQVLRRLPGSPVITADNIRQISTAGYKILPREMVGQIDEKSFNAMDNPLTTLMPGEFEMLAAAIQKRTPKLTLMHMSLHDKKALEEHRSVWFPALTFRELVPCIPRPADNITLVMTEKIIEEIYTSKELLALPGGAEESKFEDTRSELLPVAEFIFGRSAEDEATLSSSPLEPIGRWRDYPTDGGLIPYMSWYTAQVRRPTPALVAWEALMFELIRGVGNIIDEEKVLGQIAAFKAAHVKDPSCAIVQVMLTEFIFAYRGVQKADMHQICLQLEDLATSIRDQFRGRSMHIQAIATEAMEMRTPENDVEIERAAATLLKNFPPRSTESKKYLIKDLRKFENHWQALWKRIDSKIQEVNLWAGHRAEGEVARVMKISDGYKEHRQEARKRKILRAFDGEYTFAEVQNAYWGLKTTQPASGEKVYEKFLKEAMNYVTKSTEHPVATLDPYRTSLQAMPGIDEWIDYLDGVRSWNKMTRATFNALNGVMTEYNVSYIHGALRQARAIIISNTIHDERTLRISYEIVGLLDQLCLAILDLDSKLFRLRRSLGIPYKDSDPPELLEFAQNMEKIRAKQDEKYDTELMPRVAARIYALSIRHPVKINKEDSKPAMIQLISAYAIKIATTFATKFAARANLTVDRPQDTILVFLLENYPRFLIHQTTEMDDILRMLALEDKELVTLICLVSLSYSRRLAGDKYDWRRLHEILDDSHRSAKNYLWLLGPVSTIDTEKLLDAIAPRGVQFGGLTPKNGVYIKVAILDQLCQKVAPDQVAPLSATMASSKWFEKSKIESKESDVDVDAKLKTLQAAVGNAHTDEMAVIALIMKTYEPVAAKATGGQSLEGCLPLLVLVAILLLIAVLACLQPFKSEIRIQKNAAAETSRLPEQGRGLAVG